VKVLFLGGTSFLGEEIIKRLKALGGFEITLINRNDSLTHISEQDVVFNLVADYGKDEASLEQVMAANVDYPMSRLEKLQYKTIINFSTALNKEVSHYAFSKRKLEEKLFALSDSRKIQVMNLRIQHFYGPGLPEHNFVSYLITKMLKDEEVALTDCEHKRDFIYVDDLIDAVELLLKKKQDLDLKATIEIGSGHSMRLKEFVEDVKRISQSKSELKYGVITKRANEADKLVADISKLNSLGWIPKTSCAHGLEKTIKSFINLK
jgi:CDP-paratose synthetase